MADEDDIPCWPQVEAVTEQNIAAMRWLAEELARHRCGKCDGHDFHEVCDQPDWASIGKRMGEILDGR